MSVIHEIDGGILEGGGQVLRISVALSSILRQPIHVRNIRGQRSKPGLMAQHLHGIRLARDITSAELIGDEIGSTEITFKPNRLPSCGQYFADVKTAGSTTLLLQTALPILIYGQGSSELALRGGTNVGMAPQIDFTIQVLAPILRQHFGIEFHLKKPIKRGYYPKGGGELVIQIDPILNRGPLKPIHLTEFGDSIEQIRGYSFVAGVLPIKMAHQMAQSANETLVDSKQLSQSTKINIDCVKETLAFGNGSGIVLVAETSSGCRISGSELGSRNLQPDQVGKQAAEQLLNHLRSRSPVDSFTQDQLIIFMALASGKSTLLTSEITLHTRTAIFVTEQLCKAKFEIKPIAGEGLNLIECYGIGFVAGEKDN